MKIVKVRGGMSKAEARGAMERLEPIAKGKITITGQDDFVFPDNDYTIEQEFKEYMPKGLYTELRDIIRDKYKSLKKKQPAMIGKYVYKQPYEAPSILSAGGDDKKVSRTGKLVYDAEPSTQEKALKKYHHYASKYNIPISTKEHGKKTLAQLAQDINKYEHNPKNMKRILAQPIDAKFKERGLYLVDV
jgi:hypothetical protein